MPDSLTNSLQGLIDQAASRKSSGTITRYSQRLNPKQTSNLRLLLVDISGSMGNYVGSMRKIDMLRQALNRPLAPDERAFAFHSCVFPLDSLQSIPEPDGATALHLAIESGYPFNPIHTLVVSDGMPDDKQQALRAAKKLTGTISTLYIGSDNDAVAIQFMRDLARQGCGTADVCDLSKHSSSQLAGRIEQLLLKGG